MFCSLLLPLALLLSFLGHPALPPPVLFFRLLRSFLAQCNTVQHTATHFNTLQHTQQHTLRLLRSFLALCLSFLDVLHCTRCYSSKKLVCCCSVLQCVAVCCSLLQSVAVCCSVLQCVAVLCRCFSKVCCCKVLQCVEVCCSVLQCVEVHCTVLHCVALC